MNPAANAADLDITAAGLRRHVIANDQAPSTDAASVQALVRRLGEIARELRHIAGHDYVADVLSACTLHRAAAPCQTCANPAAAAEHARLITRAYAEITRRVGEAVALAAVTDLADELIAERANTPAGRAALAIVEGGRA